MFGACWVKFVIALKLQTTVYSILCVYSNKSYGTLYKYSATIGQSLQTNTLITCQKVGTQNRSQI